MRSSGSATGYSYDPVSRLASLTHDLAGTASDINIAGFVYNPAGQIVSQARNNDAYAWTAHVNVNRNYTSNGLNQYPLSGSTTLGYDARGNLTQSGSTTYTYNLVNRLTGWTGGLTMEYGARDQLIGYGATRFGYDGGQINSEWNWTPTLTTMLRRYVPGPGVDETVVWYEGSGTADRRWLHADERGSVIAISDGSGAMLNINRYDEFGIPQGSNAGRFQYTGQAWLPELGMQYSKARVYSPTLGRFMQTDPIGYGDGLNWYNYVGGDPVNGTDPTGLDVVSGAGGQDTVEWLVAWRRGIFNDSAGPEYPVSAACSTSTFNANNGSCFGTGGGVLPFLPGPGGGTGSGSEEQGQGQSELPICKTLRKESEQAKKDLPGSITTPRNWNSVSNLRYDWAIAHEVSEELEALGWYTAITSPFLGPVAKLGRVGTAAAALTGWGNKYMMDSQAKLQQNIMDGIKARLRELEAVRNGSCAK